MSLALEGTPSQELLVIRRNHKTGEVSLDPLRWGIIPYWCKDPKGGRKPINAKCETVRDLPTFRDAYRMLRVEGYQGPEGQAALCHRHEGRRAVRHCWPVGELEAAHLQRMDQDVRSDHD